MFLLGPGADLLLPGSDPVGAAERPCASLSASALHDTELARSARLCRRGQPAVLT